VAVAASPLAPFTPPAATAIPSPTPLSAPEQSTSSNASGVPPSTPGERLLTERHLDRLRSESKALADRDQAREAAQQTGEITRLRSRLATLTEERLAADTELASLRDSARRHTHRISGLEQEVLALRRGCEQAEKAREACAALAEAAWADADAAARNAIEEVPRLLGEVHSLRTSLVDERTLRAAERERLEAAAAEARQRTDELLAEKPAMQATLANLEGRASQAQAELAATARRLEETERQAATVARERDLTEAALVDLRSQVVRAEDRGQRSGSALADVEQRLHTEQLAAAALCNDLSAARAEAGELRRALDRAHEEVAQARTQGEEARMADAERHRVALQTVQRQAAQEAEAAASAAAARARKEAAAEAVAGATVANTGAVAALEAQLADLRSELSRAHAKRTEDLATANAAVITVKAEAAAANAAAKAAADAGASDAKSHMSALQIRADAAEAALARAQSDLNDLRQTLSRADAERTQAAQQASRDQLAAVETAVAAATAEAASRLSAARAAWDADAARMRRQHEEDRDQLERRAAEAEARVSTLQARLGTAEANAAAAEARANQQSSEEHARLQAQCDALRTELATAAGAARAKASALTDELTQARADLAAAQAEVESLRRRVAAQSDLPRTTAELETRLGLRDESIKSLEAELQELRTRSAQEARRVRNEAAAEVDAARTSVRERIDREVAAATEAATRAATADWVVKHTTESMTLRMEKDALSVRVGSLQSEAANLRAELEDRTRDEKSRMDGAVAALRGELDRLAATNAALVGMLEDKQNAQMKGYMAALAENVAQTNAQAHQNALGLGISMGLSSAASGAVGGGARRQLNPLLTSAAISATAREPRSALDPNQLRHQAGAAALDFPPVAPPPVPIDRNISDLIAERVAAKTAQRLFASSSSLPSEGSSLYGGAHRQPVPSSGFGVTISPRDFVLPGVSLGASTAAPPAGLSARTMAILGELGPLSSSSPHASAVGSSLGASITSASLHPEFAGSTEDLAGPAPGLAASSLGASSSAGSAPGSWGAVNGTVSYQLGLWKSKYGEAR
jgi:hypothetical protein